MDIKVDITPDAINRAVVDAILQSSIGTSIKAAIDRELTALTKTYDNPIDAVIRVEIRSVIHDMLTERDYHDKIRAFVESKLTEEFVGDLHARLWDAFMAQRGNGR